MNGNEYGYNGNYDGGEGCSSKAAKLMVILAVLVGLYLWGTFGTQAEDALVATDTQIIQQAEPEQQQDDIQNPLVDERDQLYDRNQELVERVAVLEQNLSDERQLRLQAENANQSLIGQVDGLTSDIQSLQIQVDDLKDSNEGLQAMYEIALGELHKSQEIRVVLERDNQELQTELTATRKAGAVYEALEMWFGWDVSERWAIAGLGSFSALLLSIVVIYILHGRHKYELAATPVRQKAR